MYSYYIIGHISAHRAKSPFSVARGGIGQIMQISMMLIFRENCKRS
jgi:hypothetical protein